MKLINIIMCIISLSYLVSCEPVEKEVFINDVVSQSEPLYVIYPSSDKLHYIRYEMSRGDLIFDKHYMIPLNQEAKLIDRQVAALRELFQKPYFQKRNNVFSLPENTLKVSSQSSLLDSTNGINNVQVLKYKDREFPVNFCYEKESYNKLKSVFKEHKRDEIIFSTSPSSLLDVMPETTKKNQLKTIALLEMNDESSRCYLINGNEVVIEELATNYKQVFKAIAKRLKVSEIKAKELYLKYGFVGLGEEYERPDSIIAREISQIIRKYHLMISKEVGDLIKKNKFQNVEKLYLYGNRSVADYTENLFKIELGLEVEYVNCFSFTYLGAEYTGEKRVELASHAHSVGSTVGVALRTYKLIDSNSVQVPVEL